MPREPKDRLVSLRLTVSHHDYLRSHADKSNMTLSEVMRTIIEKTLKESRGNEPTLAEVTAYLKKLSNSERDEILDKVESSKKRKFTSFINKVLNQQPAIKGKMLCKIVSEELNLPITLDLKHKVYLRIKSFRRKKKHVENLENQY